MARRRRNDTQIELFPFLSVLACVIGVLTLMIAAMALGQMDSQDVEAIEKVERHNRLQEQIEQQQDKRAELQKLIAQAEQIANQLEQARDELRRMQEAREQAEQREKEFEQRNISMLAEANELRREIERLQKDLEEIRAEIERIKQELELRQEPPDPADVVIKPGGTDEASRKMMRRIVFMEVRSNAIRVYNDLAGEDVERFSSSGIRTNLQFIELLDKLAVNNNRIVFLVREDAYAPAQWVQQIASDRGVYNGKLPVIGQGEIDLSVFQQALKGGG